MHLGAFLARGIFGDIIFDKVVQNSIGISTNWITFFPGVIGKELVNVGDERSLDCWGTSNI
jgi:hypothetical protein